MKNKIVSIGAQECQNIVEFVMNGCRKKENSHKNCFTLRFWEILPLNVILGGYLYSR